MSHTPGPWTVIPKYSTWDGFGAVEGPDGRICTLKEYEQSDDDARLISAAPDMLNALLAADIMARDVNADGDIRLPSHVWDAIRAAIAKAVQTS